MSDFTYVSTWLFVAFVINVYARRIVGWRVRQSIQTEFVLSTLPAPAMAYFIWTQVFGLLEDF